jgi:carboxypeptidase Taq
MADTTTKLNELFPLLSRCEYYEHASKILNYDMETAAPEGGMADDGRDLTELSAAEFKIVKSKRFEALVQDLYQNDLASLGEWDKRLITELEKDIQRNKHITPALSRKKDELLTQAYPIWLKAKKDDKYEEFEPTLKKIYQMQKKLVLKREGIDEAHVHDAITDDFEEGFTTQDLDTFFDDLEKGIVPLVQKVRASSSVPRHDFLTRPIPLSKQEAFTTYLLTFNGFDFTRGSVSTTIHPFTEQFGQNDVRVTTHYYETNFISNMYSVIHEGGHALFGQNLPEEVFTHHLGEGAISMGKHESVSRFYENRIGRSREYIHAIYPKFQELFHEELGDVTEEDFYGGVNYVDLSNPLRTEADELTYSLHIIIRYRLEKEILSGKANFAKLNQEWNRLYQDILGITNTHDATGILQDVHWTSGFGYFPTYAIGNALNALYIQTLDKDISLRETVSAGQMDKVLAWMKAHVFAKATLLPTKEWIKDITGNDFSAKPYVDYLTAKYTELYHLN